MKKENVNNLNNSGLQKYVTPLGAWSLALGTSIGWGSFVVTCNMYLGTAGPAGSVLGMIAGAIVMLIVSRNYHFMMNRYPDSGGIYTYCKNAFGYDQGFLTGWFLSLTYIAMFWANATFLPLFARYFLGDTFRFGPHYTIFDYDVYFGEALLSIAAVLLIGFLCMKFKKAALAIIIGMVILFCAGILICFIASMVKHDGGAYSFDPAYIPGKDVLSQILKIACISPWAFIGFENISHSTAEFTFPVKKAFRILTSAVIVTTLLYVAVILLSVTAYPSQYSSWHVYISNLDKLEGIEGLPAFYAAHHYMGNAGIALLILTLFALIISSLIGNIIALSRLIYAMALDGVFPKGLAKLSRDGNPVRAIQLIIVISIFIPFLGRTAVGWIVDVTTLGATLVYGFISAATLKLARKDGQKAEQITGAAGLAVMVIFALMLLLPNIFATGSMAKESYILFTVWAIIGIAFFRWILSRDKARHFGKSVVVWIALLLLVLFTSMQWMGQLTREAADEAADDVTAYYVQEYGVDNDVASEKFVGAEMGSLYDVNTRSTAVVFVLIALSLAILMNNYSYQRRREIETERELGRARAIAYKDALTGVKSKHAYTEEEEVLNVRIQDKTIEDFSIVVCDVNGLKEVNDTLGHKAGDEYIRSASRLICDVFKHSPVYRIGGDEFVAVLTGQDRANKAVLMEEFDRRVERNKSEGRVVIAAGISDFVPDFDTNAHSVFERADELMYKRKKALKEG